MQKNDNRIKEINQSFTEMDGKKGVHREVKDRLFRFLFTQDREALLQLYNALNGTDYQDASQLQVVTIENAVYVTMKNDLAFILAGTISLYEHQSTYNANMPLRFLIYLTHEYQKLVEEIERSLRVEADPASYAAVHRVLQWNEGRTGGAGLKFVRCIH